MSSNSFRQRHFLNTRQFEITENGVQVKEGSFFSSRTYTVPFESISDELVEASTSSKLWLWITIGATLLFLSAVSGPLFGEPFNTRKAVDYSTILAVCSVRYWTSRQSYIGYRGVDEPLVFYKDQPSQEELEAFMESVQERKRAYFRENYMPSSVKGESVASELQRITWLKERGALTEEEFQSLKRDLLGDKSQERSNFGFKS